MLTDKTESVQYTIIKNSSCRLPYLYYFVKLTEGFVSEWIVHRRISLQGVP
jgi:hypothetical protein